MNLKKLVKLKIIIYRFNIVLGREVLNHKGFCEKENLMEFDH